jgi:serine protease Do
MNSQNLRQRAGQMGLVALGAAALVTGAAWRGAAVAPQASGTHTVAAVTSPITRAVAGGRDSYADVVNVVAPAVVTVHANGKARMSQTEFQMPDGQMPDLFRRFFGGPDDQGQSPFGRSQRRQMPQRAPRQHALGSGVIVGADGYVLTNNHVIDGADDIKVDLTDGRTLSAKLVGTDKASDLALLKIAASDLHPIALGNSDAVQVGDVVLAVGNPLNLGQTVTMGIISAKGRSTGVGDGSYEDFLQTDAPINHGNSGGALVNTKGELVGINSQILSPSDGNIGIGFAIPANMARHVMDELRTNGKVTRAQLGVTVQNVTSDMAQTLGLKQVGGVIVGSVSSGSAAERSGIKQGDVITSFNGQPVHDMNSLRNRVADAKPGSSASVSIVRDGAEKTVNVKLDEAQPTKSARNDEGSGSDDKTALGVSVEPLTPEIAPRIGVSRSVRGLVIDDVNADGRAADAGLQAGDVIEQVNRQPVQTAEELKAAIRRSADRPVLLLINRQGSDLFVTVRP